MTEIGGAARDVELNPVKQSVSHFFSREMPLHGGVHCTFYTSDVVSNVE